MLVHSHDPNISNVCSGIYISFLADYTHKKDRIEQQLQFLWDNLRYDFENGRLAVLETLTLAIKRLKPDVIERFFEGFLLPLMLTMMNDPSTACRERAQGALSTLLDNVPKSCYKTLASFTDRWMRGTAGSLLAGVRFLGLAVDASQIGLQNVLGESISLACSELPNDGEALEAAVLAGHLSTENAWEVVYFRLVLLEKLVAKKRLDLLAIPIQEGVWKGVSILIAHPHAWVKQASHRLLEAYLTQAHLSCDILFKERSALFGIAKSILFFLGGSTLDKESGDVPLRNLLHLSRIFYERPEVAALQRSERAEEEEEGEERNKVPQSPLRFVVVRLSYLCRREDLERRRLIFMYYGALAGMMKDGFIPFLEPALSGLYRVAEAPRQMEQTEGPQDEEELRQLALDTMQVLRDSVGSTLYLKAYREVKASIDSLRSERKRKRVTEVFTDPVRAAQRKLHKTETKKVSRKKKNEKYRELRHQA